jgi:hypothetical protein
MTLGSMWGLTVKFMHVQIHLSLAGANSYWVMWATGQGKVSLCSADISLTIVLSAHLQISLPSNNPAEIEAALSVRKPEKLGTANVGVRKYSASPPHWAIL